MWLVLCEPKDLTALWAYRGLRARGLQPIELVSGESLAYSTSLEHRLESNKPGSRIKLTDGRAIDGASVRGTLNRLHKLPAEHLRAANHVDRQYAEQEFYALFLSLLYGFPGAMFNRPSPRGLCGAWRHPSEWNKLASRVGLTTDLYRQGDNLTGAVPARPPGAVSQTVIVLAGRCFAAPAPPHVQQGCLKLAQASDMELLGVDFYINGNREWVFAGATPMPEMRLGGERLLDALLEAFKS